MEIYRRVCTCSILQLVYDCLRVASVSIPSVAFLLPRFILHPSSSLLPFSSSFSSSLLPLSFPFPLSFPLLFRSLCSFFPFALSFPFLSLSLSLPLSLSLSLFPSSSLPFPFRSATFPPLSLSIPFPFPFPFAFSLPFPFPVPFPVVSPLLFCSFSPPLPFPFPYGRPFLPPFPLPSLLKLTFKLLLLIIYVGCSYREEYLQAPLVRLSVWLWTHSARLRISWHEPAPRKCVCNFGLQTGELERFWSLVAIPSRWSDHIDRRGVERLWKTSCSHFVADRIAHFINQIGTQG